MLAQAIIGALGASSLALAWPAIKQPLPTRYKNGVADATFLYSGESGGIATPPTQYQTVYIQAIDGELVFTQNPPTRICPCSDSFGAQNFTGYYIGETKKGAPTLQLFTSSPGAQYVYVAQDLSIRYTLPGEPIPPGANGTSIFFYEPEPLGSSFPSNSASDVKGFVTSPTGKRTYYNNLQFCAPENSPPRTENGVGPLKILAAKTEGNTPDGKGVVGDRCVSGTLFTSINDPKVGPYDISFMTPSEPLAFAYKNGVPFRELVRARWA